MSSSPPSSVSNPPATLGGRDQRLSRTDQSHPDAPQADIVDIVPTTRWWQCSVCLPMGFLGALLGLLIAFSLFTVGWKHVPSFSWPSWEEHKEPESQPPKSEDPPKLAKGQVVESETVTVIDDSTLTPVADTVWKKSPLVQHPVMDFEVWVTSSDLAFDYGRVDRLRLANQSMSLDTHVTTPIFMSHMQSCQAMVVVGAASQEGDEAVEMQRARDRAEFAQFAMWNSGQVRCPLYTLSVGKALAQNHVNPSQTAYQRRLVVLNIVRVSDNGVLRSDAAMASALRKALRKIEGLPVNLLTQYAAFEVERKH